MENASTGKDLQTKIEGYNVIIAGEVSQRMVMTEFYEHM